MQNKPKLFCFTYAGGTAAFFDEIEQDLEDVDIVKLEYSGHGERHKEGFYKDFDELADDMFSVITGQHVDQYALFGYSMGSISAVEVLKRILSSNLPAPSNVFLCAHEPKTRYALQLLSEDELDNWVKERTIQFGDVPKKLMNNRVFWRTYLPIYRADYTIIGKYSFEELNLQTDIPTTVFYSETDTPLEDMRLWENYFKGLVEYQEYDGNHFFIREHHKEIAEVIKIRLGV